MDVKKRAGEEGNQEKNCKDFRTRENERNKGETMEKELVSIIIPVYNAEKYIKTCIDGIKRQTYSGFECFLINDGSKDSSEHFIQEKIEGDDRFQYIYQKNAGPSNARNAWINRAKGKYTIFIDADDRIEKDYIEQLVKQIEHIEET